MSVHAVTRPPTVAFAGISLGDVAAQLREMLEDEDWSPACQDDARLRALLTNLQRNPACAEAAAPPGIALLASAYQDFCRFRRELATHLQGVDGDMPHASPDEWLQWRLHQYANGSAPSRMYADCRMHMDRFHVS